jgi:HPr kinase/phosphorylase
MQDSPLTLHASCVAVDGRGILIRGASGTGKSALALQLMALGARLIADDQTILTRIDNRLQANCPAATRGMIEARGVGILAADTLDHADILLIVDLDRTETERLPPRRHMTLLNLPISLVFASPYSHFVFAIMQHARAGRVE